MTELRRRFSSLRGESPPQAPPEAKRAAGAENLKHKTHETRAFGPSQMLKHETRRNTRLLEKVKHETPSPVKHRQAPTTSKIGSRNGFVRFGKFCIIRSLSPYGVLNSGHKITVTYHGEISIEPF